MSRKSINYSNFITLLSYRTKTSERKIKKIYGAIIDLIVEELKINGEITLQGLATFEAKYVEGGDRKVPVTFGSKETMIKYMKPSVKINIKPSKTLKELMIDYIYKDDDNFVAQVKRQEKKDEVRQLLSERFNKSFDVIKEESLIDVFEKEEENEI